MNEDFSKSFIKEVLLGLWPGWEPTEMEFELWIKKLRRYDYAKSKTACSDFILESERLYKRPPIGRLFKYLNSKKCTQALKNKDTEPVIAFELFDPEDERWAISFAVRNIRALKARAIQDFEQESLKMAEKCSKLYRRNLIVRQLWNKYLEYLPI